MISPFKKETRTCIFIITQIRAFFNTLNHSHSVKKFLKPLTLEKHSVAVKDDEVITLVLLGDTAKLALPDVVILGRLGDGQGVAFPDGYSCAGGIVINIVQYVSPFFICVVSFCLSVFCVAFLLRQDC